MGERTYLVLSNHTQRDIHIQVKGDVHTGNWGPHQVNNNHAPEVKSRKIDFGNQATYEISVWSNNNGQPGEHIVDFKHHVRYNLAGNRDHLEFVIWDENGETKLKVLSVRLGIAVAIAIWIDSLVGSPENDLLSQDNYPESHISH